MTINLLAEAKHEVTTPPTEVSPSGHAVQSAVAVTFEVATPTLKFARHTEGKHADPSIADE